MPKFKLICDHSCDLDTHIVTHEFDAEHISDVIMNLDMFLKGAGYVYQGELALFEDQGNYYPEHVGAGSNVEFGGAGNGHSQHFFDTGRNR